MAEITNTKGSYALDFLMLPSEYVPKFNEFMTQYGELSDHEIFKNIIDIKSQISSNVLNQHINNLNLLSQMNGFVNETTKQRIQLVKGALAEDTGSSNSHNVVETQFFGGTSLLLWFLILAGIWRRPFYGFRGRPGFGGGFFGRRPYY